MTMTFNEPDDSFDDFALPEETGEISSPAPLVFAPWHKPRKQYVRRHQWIHHANSTINRLKSMGRLNANTPLRYLTLPGPDLLDVKLMADVCSQNEISLHYTGFCYVRDSDAIRLRRNTQRFEIDRGNLITPGSDVHVSKLEDITRPRSEAKTLMERGGPYNIINIDACAPIATDGNNQTGRLVDAIRTIVDFQLNMNRQPWLLYLTTPVQIDSVSQSARTALNDQVRQNVLADNVFATELAGRYLEGEEVSQYLERAAQENGHEFVRTITLGISKWLVHLAEQASFNVIKLPAACYSMFRREPFVPNMISTCYLFEPQRINLLDFTGLTQDTHQAPGTARTSDHIRALRQSMEIENLDETFSNDGQLRAEMIQETKELLAAVGYDVDHPVDGYDAWLAREPLEYANQATPVGV
jgi:hypothetical protein